MSPRSQTGVTRDLWLTPRGIGHVPDTPWRSGRPRGPSDPGPSRQRHRVDLAGHRTGARVARDCRSSPRALGPKRDSPGTAGRTSGLSDTGSSRPGQLVDVAGFRASAESPGTAGQHSGPSDHCLSSRDSCLTARVIWHIPKSPRRAGRPRALGHKLESPGRVGRHCGSSDTGPSRAG